MNPTAALDRLARACVGLLVAVLLCAQGAGAQSLTDEQLRARFLVNFLRFTKWPEGAFATPSAPIGICVLEGNGDPLGGALAELEGVSVGSRKLEIHGRIDERQIPGCQLLYVPDDSLPRLAGAREASGNRPMLVVGESEAILDRGGMIALRANDRHLSFVVRLAPAHRLGLRFDSQMLSVAAEVLP